MHPAWSTLEEITLVGWPHPLFDNPHLQARQLRAIDRLYTSVSTQPRPLKVTALAGGERTGIKVSDEMLDAFERDDVFASVRRIELDGKVAESLLTGVRPLLGTRLIAQLDHLQLMFARPVRAEELKTWKERFLATRLPRLGVSCPLAIRGTYIHLEIDRGDELVIEVEKELERSHIDEALLAARALGEGRRVTLRDVHHRSEVATRQKKLIKGLEQWFDDVVTSERDLRR
jgi:hypothetical protein